MGFVRKRVKATCAVSIAALAVVAAVSFGAYFIRDDSGGEVLWNANEAYFFIHVFARGLHLSWLEYPWYVTKTFLGVPIVPDDERRSLAVVRVTSDGVERHIVTQKGADAASGPGQYTPRGGHIYANYPALGGLCIWAVDHFEPAPAPERRVFDGIMGLTAKDFDSGWTKRGFGATGLDSTFTVDVGTDFSLLVRTMDATKTGRGAISIDKEYFGRAPTQTQIFNLEIRKARISSSEYRRIFFDSP
jgi:hypothetical protein